MAGAGQFAEPEGGFLAFPIQADQLQLGFDLYFIGRQFESFKVTAGAELDGSAWVLLHKPEDGR